MTTVRATRHVECPFSACIDFCEEALRARPDITLLTQHAELTTQIAEDVSDSVRRHDALLLGWHPRLAVLFPDFHGALTVRPKGRGVWLRIQGSYEPPFGAAGRIFDMLVGRFIARFTLARLLRDLSRTVERRWSAFRRELTA